MDVSKILAGWFDRLSRTGAFLPLRKPPRVRRGRTFDGRPSGHGLCPLSGRHLQDGEGWQAWAYPTWLVFGGSSDARGDVQT